MKTKLKKRRIENPPPFKIRVWLLIIEHHKTALFFLTMVVVLFCMFLALHIKQSAEYEKHGFGYLLR